MRGLGHVYRAIGRRAARLCRRTWPSTVPTQGGQPTRTPEAALLGRAWGLTPDWVIRGITQTMHYFTGFRGLYTAADAVDDLLREWTT